MKLEWAPRTLRFSQPVVTAWGSLREREIVEVTVTGNDGVAGRGEACALEPYDGVTTADVLSALTLYSPILDAVADGGRDALDRCRDACELPQALAAIDLALWDRAGRVAGQPVAALLRDGPARAVAVNASIGAVSPEKAADEATAARRAGYGAVKVKVGAGDDLARVSAVRAALGPDVTLRCDANGTWSPADAAAAIDALSPYGVELFEEPVHGLAAVRELRALVGPDVTLALDETAREAGALSDPTADLVCLKVSACGGISGLLAAASLVRARGGEVYLASTYDGPLGIAAAVHCAAALAPLPHCGLATLGLFEGVDDVLAVRDGAIAVPGGPGLGI